MMRDILLATDFSPCSKQATRFAVEYALRSGARLHLLHVVPNGDPSPGDELARLAERLASQELSIVTKSEWGDPSERILAYARTAGIELIVLGTHGRTGVTRVLLGSVSESVARQATCPVLTVPITARGDAVTRPEEEPPPSSHRCLVCSERSGDLICMPCRTRIRAAALEHKREQERTGHVPV